MTAVVTAKLQAVRSDQVLVNSSLIFLTTAMMAGAGAVFWVIAARLASPQSVGLAGSLVSAADSLALFAQLGLNIAVLRTMPTSNRKAADVLTASLVVGTAGAGFALVYSLLLPMTSPKLAAVLHSPAVIAMYCVLVAGTAVNVLSDNVFLSLNRVWSYLRLNGVLLGLTKCVLPFLLAGAGALGLYASVGGAMPRVRGRQPLGDPPARPGTAVVVPFPPAARGTTLRRCGLRDLRAHGPPPAGVPAVRHQRAGLLGGCGLLRQLPGGDAPERRHPGRGERDVRRERARAAGSSRHRASRAASP